MAKPWHRWPPPLQTGGPLRQAIYRRDGNRCRIGLPGCTREPTHLDHIVSPELGGAWFDPHNLRAACEFCNLSRSNPASSTQAAEHQEPSRRW